MLWNNSITSAYWGIYSSPAVANGVVYISSDDHNLYALNATDGRQLWVYPTENWVESSPTVANGIVYVSSEDENLYALNAANGEKFGTTTLHLTLQTASLSRLPTTWFTF